MWDLIVSVPDHCLSFYFMYFHIIVFLKMRKASVCSISQSFWAVFHSLKRENSILDNVLFYRGLSCLTVNNFKSE